MDSALEDRLARLGQLADADGGFFVLALHSFVESYIRDVVPGLRTVTDFSDLLWAYRERVAVRGGTAADLDALTRIIREHSIVQQVTHAFLELDHEEILAAIHNFRSFCALCGIDPQKLGALESALQSWEEKHSALKDGEELAAMRTELLFAQEDNAKLLAQSVQWAADKQRLAELDGETMRLSAELDKEKARTDARPPRIAEIQGARQGPNAEAQPCGRAFRLRGPRPVRAAGEPLLPVHAHAPRLRAKRDEAHRGAAGGRGRAEARRRFPRPGRGGHGEDHRPAARPGEDTTGRPGRARPPSGDRTSSFSPTRTRS